jgi:Transposase DDE domain group 1
MKALTTASSETDCKDQPLFFQDLGSRKVVADFSGGILSSDGGLLLLRQVDRGLGVSAALAGCFRDERDARWVEHSVQQLLAQRLYALALGYEDLNDHALLRHDPLLAVACEKTDPLGRDRFLPQFRAAALACPATLNRLELSNHKSSRAHKLTHDPAQVEATLLKLGVRCLPKHAQEIVLDLDTTGALLHGQQEGRFFDAYHGGYCYEPLYVFCGNIPLWARLHTADRDAADGAVEAMAQILAAIRKRCRHARIILRADSGFARPELMALCERWPEVYYGFGLQRNPRLVRHIERALAEARARQIQCGGVATRVFTEFEYTTLKSWPRPRRVIGKAEFTAQGPNPRFVVTNLPAEGFAHDHDPERFTPARLYEQFYCPRGQMENVLKQQLLDLKADRLSTHHLGSNQLRLWMSTLAYLLLERVRALGCAGTELAVATVGSVRVKLLKVAATVRVSVRRVYVQLSSAYPLQSLFALCHRRLMRLGSASG